MADDDPPEPPPLLRPSPHRVPTNAERLIAEREDQERLEKSFWHEAYVQTGGCNLVLLIGVTIAILALAGSMPLDSGVVLTLYSMVATR